LGVPAAYRKPDIQVKTTAAVGLFAATRCSEQSQHGSVVFASIPHAEIVRDTNLETMSIQNTINPNSGLQTNLHAQVCLKQIKNFEPHKQKLIDIRPSGITLRLPNERCIDESQEKTSFSILLLRFVRELVNCLNLKYHAL